MMHLCAFLQDETAVPMGYVLAHGDLYNSRDYTALFDFDLTKSAGSLAEPTTMMSEIRVGPALYMAMW